MKSLKLIGIKGAQQYEHWRLNTMHALEALGIPISLQEINEVDNILAHNVGAIPALLINDMIVLEQNSHIPDINEIKQNIVHFAELQNLQFPEPPPV
jgi:hypothetical protein